MGGTMRSLRSWNYLNFVHKITFLKTVQFFSRKLNFATSFCTYFIKTCQFSFVVNVVNSFRNNFKMTVIFSAQLLHFYTAICIVPSKKTLSFWYQILRYWDLKKKIHKIFHTSRSGIEHWRLFNSLNSWLYKVNYF